MMGTNRKQIAAALGLADDATDKQITDRIAALSALEKAPKVPKTMTAALGLAEGADEAAALAALTRLKGAGTLAEVASLQHQVAGLSDQLQERDVAELVSGAIAAYKLMPAQWDWAMSLGKLDMAALKAFVDCAPPIPGLAGQTGGIRRDGGGEANCADPTEVAREALTYQAAQLAAGVQVSTQQAVDAVLAVGKL
jgi:phage I-like protein